MSTITVLAASLTRTCYLAALPLQLLQSLSLRLALFVSFEVLLLVILIIARVSCRCQGELLKELALLVLNFLHRVHLMG